jgi:hypothetical protein
MRNPRNLRSDCPSCATSGSGSDELCVACRDAFRWVVKPEAHREHRRRQIAGSVADRDGLESQHPLTGSFPANNGIWNCDLCDTQIDVPAEFTLIPLYGSCALCTSCAERSAAWPEGWAHPRPRACRCRACQTPIALALTL